MPVPNASFLKIKISLCEASLVSGKNIFLFSCPERILKFYFSNSYVKNICLFADIRYVLVLANINLFKKLCT